MSDAVPVVWLASDPAAEARPDARTRAEAALASWARARGVTLGALDELGGLPREVDMSAGDRVEKELDRAREATAALDVDAAERALARAEAELRAHPDLPQAAWLRAEVERAWAARLSRVDPRDMARAALAWRHAAALDVGRLPGVGESDHGTGARVPARIVVEGLPPSAIVVRLDGNELSATESLPTSGVYDAAVAPAEHHVVVYEDGRPLFASWVWLGDSASAPVRVALSSGGACSRVRMANVVQQGMTVRAQGITCPRWIAAVPDARTGTLLVARCARETCGPLLAWRSEGLGSSAMPQAVDERRRAWPAWAAFFTIGVGAAAATAITLIATGALEARPVEPRFVAGGARVE